MLVRWFKVLIHILALRVCCGCHLVWLYLLMRHGSHTTSGLRQTCSEFPAITKSTPANHVAEILQLQHSINTSTNPVGCHMSNFIRQNEVNMANEPLKVEKPLLESSSEIDKLQCITNTQHSPDTKITVSSSFN